VTLFFVGKMGEKRRSRDPKKKGRKGFQVGNRAIKHRETEGASTHHGGRKAHRKNEGWGKGGVLGSEKPTQLLIGADMRGVGNVRD